ncbi:winged helix DNA-binding domain-containing protein [Ammonicoccus fulvus]|uniref:Winged helix DNA-binding domain-containing protein n=1 Tax=Ammonicoccus fulvus TaxID=3138240 RepID=A0ABZ3FW44_9ACTN
MKVTRDQALRHRWRVQQLSAAPDSVGSATDVAILDLGVQSGAGDAGRLALRNRGVSSDEAQRVTTGFTDDLALVWSVRGAPHFYRRDDLRDVERAVWPVSPADAAKRSAGAARDPIDHLAGMVTIAEHVRAALSEPMTKGEVSASTRETLPPELLVDCRPCGVTHVHEQLLRIATIHGGVELEPGTNPPNLRRVPGWRRKPAPDDPLTADSRHRLAEGYLHFLGPATPKDLAAFCETTVGEAKKLWPTEGLVEVDRAGEKAWILADDVDALTEAAAPGEPDQIRLLNGFDLFLAAKDRHLLTDGDNARHKQLWPILGRPGVIVADGIPVGTWRPRSKGRALRILVDWWVKPTKARLAATEAAAAVLTGRDQEFAGFSDK